MRGAAFTVEESGTWLATALTKLRTLSVPLPLTWRGIRTRTGLRTQIRTRLRTLSVAVAEVEIRVEVEPGAKTSREMLTVTA